MNSLSWMIYLAEVAGSMSSFLTLTSIGSGFVAIGAAVTWMITDGKPHVLSWEDREQKYERFAAINDRAKTTIKPALAAMLAAGAVATILPSKSTVYAIAASEMGEQVINTPTAGKAIKALDAWLDRQIAGKSEPQE